MAGGFDEQRLSDHLAERYGIAPRKLTALEAGVVRVDHEGAPWVVRIFKPGRPVERAAQEAEILRFLEEQDYPAERCANDDPVSELDGRAVLVTLCAEGTPPGRGGRAAIPLWTFEQLGDLLGRLHSLADLPRAAMREAGSWHGDPRFEGLPSQDLAAGRAWLDEIEDRVPASRREPLHALHDRLAAADGCDDLPRALIHPDFDPVNAITTSGGRITIVDWAGAGLGPQVSSFANLLWSAVGDHEGTQKDRIDVIVKGYRRHVWLEDDELARLEGAIGIRPLLFACYYYRSSVQSNYIPTGNEPWWPNDSAIHGVARTARGAFKAETLPRTAPAGGDEPKPEIPGQLSLET